MCLQAVLRATVQWPDGTSDSSFGTCHIGAAGDFKTVLGQKNSIHKDDSLCMLNNITVNFSGNIQIFAYKMHRCGYFGLICIISSWQFHALNRMPWQTQWVAELLVRLELLVLVRVCDLLESVATANVYSHPPEQDSLFCKQSFTKYIVYVSTCSPDVWLHYFSTIWCNMCLYQIPPIMYGGPCDLRSLHLTICSILDQLSVTPFLYFHSYK